MPPKKEVGHSLSSYVAGHSQKPAKDLRLEMFLANQQPNLVQAPLLANKSFKYTICVN